MPLSVLDRALTRRGEHSAQALRATVQFAQQAEELGYHRFWVAEHHGVPGIAGSAPTVLAAAVAAATTHIRVGTGGVMLPNHQPLVVAEQFGVLESLHPGRIDMGLGRSVGFTDGVRTALGVGKEAADRFAEQLGELLGYFAGAGPVRAQPAAGLQVPAFVLAVGAGAGIAAQFGLPLVVPAHRDEARTVRAVEQYRAAFQPSAQSPDPHVLLAVNVAAAATEHRAALLQAPEAWSTVLARTRGDFAPLIPPTEVTELAMTERERTLYEETRGSQLHGTEEQLAPALAGLVDRTGASELLLTLNTYDPQDRLDSYRRLARLTGRDPEAADHLTGRPSPAAPAS